MLLVRILDNNTLGGVDLDLVHDARPMGDQGRVLDEDDNLWELFGFDVSAKPQSRSREVYKAYGCLEKGYSQDEGPVTL